ncbi:hypothetical protein [Microbacterium sp. cf046]|nr:hypothetical protein [Microbacterium sp. cf046]
MADPDDRRPRVSPTRIGIWIVVCAVGVFMVISGLISVLNGG